MKLDQGKHVIVMRDHGAFSAFACTVAKAQQLLDSYLHNLQADVRELAQLDRNTHYVVPANRVSAALKEVLSLPAGEAAPRLRTLLHGGPKARGDDTRPAEVVTDAWKTEAVLWCARQKLNPVDFRGVSASTLKGLDTASLSMLDGVRTRAKGKALHFVEADTLESAEELATLKAGHWKDGVDEHKVVARYIQFIRDHLVSRDTALDVVELEA